MVARVGAVIALALLLGFSGSSPLSPHGTVEGHVFGCSGSLLSAGSIVEIYKSADSTTSEQLVAWQSVPADRMYQFVVGPGDYRLTVDSGSPVAVRVDSGDQITQDLTTGCS
jgi:hypothetical protein